MQVQFAINTFFSAINVSILYISKDCEFCSFSHMCTLSGQGDACQSKMCCCIIP